MNKKHIILDNYFGLTDINKLIDIEARIVSPRIHQLKDLGITGNFNAKHLKSIHQYLFCEIYPWAGKFREGGVHKQNKIPWN